MEISVLRTMDSAGRIVVPKKLRVQNGLEAGAPVLIYQLGPGQLGLCRAGRECALCGSPEILDEELPVCTGCAQKVAARLGARP